MHNEHRLVRVLIYLFAFSVPLSIAIAEPLAYLILAAWGWGRLRRGPTPSGSCVLLMPFLVFCVIAMLSSMIGIRPALSLEKGTRLLLFAPMLALPWAAGDLFRVEARRVVYRVVMCFLVAATLLAAYDAIRIPAMVLHKSLTSSGLSWQVPALWFAQGNMRDPQFYLIALCFLMAFWAVGPREQRGPLLWLATGLISFGLVLQFKRGAWLAFFMVTLLLGLITRKWKVPVIVALCAVVLLLLPQVRARMGMIGQEKLETLGGRRVLWTQVAPALIREHPLGMGWCATRHEDLAEKAAYLQPHLNHLHNNMLQVCVETGIPGLIAWMCWMLTAFIIMGLAYWRARHDAEQQDAVWLACGTWLAFSGLLANGLVEANFRDSEILMAFALLMGLGTLLYNYSHKDLGGRSFSTDSDTISTTT